MKGGCENDQSKYVGRIGTNGKKRIVDIQFFEEIILDLIDGNSVKLTSFGTFSVKHKKERIGRNPKTKEEAIIDARRVISFKASKELKRRVDN